MDPRALVLTGSLGAGHDVTAEVVGDSLGDLGFEVRTVDCMALLGRLGARVGDRVFRAALGVPPLYDAFHFSQLRPGGALAVRLDRAATRRLAPAVGALVAAEGASLVVATFATGASAAAQAAQRAVAGQRDAPKVVVVCTDVTPHRLWVRPGVDLFLVTSAAAVASVRRYQPGAPVRVVAAPVRSAFARPPGRHAARNALGVPLDAPCVLVMGGGWGYGPVAESAKALAARGVEVLAVAGHNRRLHRALSAAAAVDRRVHAFGFTDEVPLLMAASDLVLTHPGASTCAEARAVRRPLVLIDVLPGHGRDNIQHELELGDADVCSARPAELTRTVLAALERRRCGPELRRRDAAGPDAWGRSFRDALRLAGTQHNTHQLEEID